MKSAHIVFVHDLVIAALSLVLALYLRLGNGFGQHYLDVLMYGVPLMVAIAGVTFHAFGMYRGIWRYASVSDLLAIVKAATVAILIFMPIMFLINRLEEMPRSVPAIQWLLLIVMLGGPRFLYRIVLSNGHWAPTRHEREGQVPVVVVGTSDHAALFIRAMSGDPAAPYRVVGILDETGKDLGRRIHSVPVLGRVEHLPEVVTALAARRQRPQRVIIAGPTTGLSPETVGALLERAEAMGLTVARLPSLVDFRAAVSDGRLELRPVALEDLLGRPQTVLDRTAIRQLIEGRYVLVTGAGGTIGSELTRQIAALAPGQIILLDSSEFNLYSIDAELRERHPDLRCQSILCNIRERERVFQVFARWQPELVFHAGALKHVPMVELNPGEGVLTNVLGTRNVADAAASHHARAMVQVSTDKAINPTSIMGATKRLAELYCQSLDLTGRLGNGSSGPSPRFMTVRFGNVLGSSGSVVPLFERQLARGGPLTVTHPEIRRFFMTVREAVELVLQASAHGVAHPDLRGQIFVLDMGKPIKVVDIARQMIRLAGLRPDIDVQIAITGLRPGEKLYEELFDHREARLPAAVDGVFLATSCAIKLDVLRSAFDDLETVARRHDLVELQSVMSRILPGYQPEVQLPAPVVATNGAGPARRAPPGRGAGKLELHLRAVAPASGPPT